MLPNRRGAIAQVNNDNIYCDLTGRKCVKCVLSKCILQVLKAHMCKVIAPKSYDELLMTILYRNKIGTLYMASIDSATFAASWVDSNVSTRAFNNQFFSSQGLSFLSYKHCFPDVNLNVSRGHINSGADDTRMRAQVRCGCWEMASAAVLSATMTTPG